MLAVGILIGLAVGLVVGLVLGRRTAGAAMPQPSMVVPQAPSKRAVKAGLSEDAFVTSDDILERLRLVSEGKLDPSVLAPPAEEGEGEAERDRERDERLAEAERRVLDRLRDQAPGTDA